MNDLCAEIGFKSINHVGEQLCGDHVDVIDRAYRENWIDVYETPGKDSGAFSMGPNP